MSSLWSTKENGPFASLSLSSMKCHQLAWQLGDKASGLHWWCSSISWALASRRAAPQKQLFSGLKRYKSFAKGLKRDFVLRSRLLWTCLDCPPSRCQQLDEQVTAAGRYPCACKMHVVGPRVCIFRPIWKGNGEKDVIV